MAAFEYQPTLEGKRVCVRALTPGDREALYSVAKDPLIWELHPQRDRHQREVFDDFFDQALIAPGSCALIESFSGEVMGSSRYYDFDPDRREICIGYTFIARKYWGQAHNREIKKLMIEHAFGSVDRVIFHVGEKNIRSRRAVGKIGGVLIGEILKTLRDGSPNPSVIYQIEKSNYRGL